MVLADALVGIGGVLLYPTKKKPPVRFMLLKPKYAPAAEMLANADQHGGTLAVLELLAKQTEEGG